jgi:hypothetical protein
VANYYSLLFIIYYLSGCPAAGWAGGSYLSEEDVWPTTQLAAIQQQQQQQQQLISAPSQGASPALSISRRLAAAGQASSAAGKARVAFVSYKGASHCTVSFTWQAAYCM